MKKRNGLMGIVLLFASALSLVGCLSTYGEGVVRDLTYVGMRQAVVSGVQNSIEGPRGTTVNVMQQGSQQKYYDGKMIDGGHYKGEMFNHKPHGFGTYTSPDRSIYVGQFKDGMRDGQGTHTMPDGRKYVGQSKQGKKDGQGTHTWPDGAKYVGRFKDETFDGQGTFTLPDGKIKEGIWQKGKFLGKLQKEEELKGTTVNVASGGDNVVQQGGQQKYYDGKMTDGGHYKGETFDNKPHGLGTYIYPNGDKYVGQYRYGMKEGQGTYTYLSGEKHVGQWKDDKHDGQGTYTWLSGEKYVGQFKHGKKEGQGTHTFLNGVFVGDFKDNVECKGKFNGKDGTVLTGIFNCGTTAGTIDYPDGRKYDGEWNGDANFLGITTSPGNWTVDEPHGVGKMMYLDGKIEEGIWQKGKFLGESYARK